MRLSVQILTTITLVFAGAIFAKVLLPQTEPDLPSQIDLPSGEFLMGSDSGALHEQPKHLMKVDAFALDRSPVSVVQFSDWIQQSDYQTEAEKFGDSLVFTMETGKWTLEDGANWQYPMGPNSPIAEPKHPVTQVSWNDALQYCKAQHGRLPTEAEFEYAAKGAGQYEEPVYAFGDKEVKDGVFLANIFNGEFPFKNTNADGYTYTSPIGETGLTQLGFTDMAGNVWEWTSDWYGPYLKDSPKLEKSLRGGSFLCDKDVCHGYTTTGRTHSTPESSLVHSGFRCAYDLAKR